MIRTLSILLGAILLPGIAFTQVNENFEDGLAVLSGKCWQFNNTKFTSPSAPLVINGNSSIISDPPVSASTYRTVTTPYLNVTGNSISISFVYQLSSQLQNNATRIIDAGVINSSGVYSALKTIALNSTSATTVQTFEINNAPLAPGAYRVMIRFAGQTGDGNCRILADDLSVDAGYYYTNYCNAAPVTSNDSYTGIQAGTFNGPSILLNDQEPDGETMTAVLVNNSPDGNVTINPDGTFIFIPNSNFNGTSTSFTYRAVDNGYNPATSNTSTVQIEFEPVSQAPVLVVGFHGTVNNLTINLEWDVNFNEMITGFELERSKDGFNFSTISNINASNQSGTAEYEFFETATSTKTYYRLKIISLNGDEEYSDIICMTVNSANLQNKITIFGNPVTSALKFNFVSVTNEQVLITITNTSGTTVYSQAQQVNKGINQFIIPNVSGFQSGTYILKITGPSGILQTTMFVKL